MSKRIALCFIAMLSIGVSLVFMPVAVAVPADISRGRGFYPIFDGQDNLLGNAFFDFKVSSKNHPKYGLGYMNWMICEGTHGDDVWLFGESMSIDDVVFSVDQNGLKAVIIGVANVVGCSPDTFDPVTTNFVVSVWDGDPLGKPDQFKIELDIDNDGTLVSGQVTITDFGGTINVDDTGRDIPTIIGANDSNTGVSPDVIDPIKGNIFNRFEF